MPKEKVSKCECDRTKIRARKCSITAGYAADNRRAVVREAEVVQRQLTQEINQLIGKNTISVHFIKLNSHKHS